MLFTRRRFVQRVAPVLIAPVLAFPAAAQQVQKVAAAGGPDFSKCDQIKNPAWSAQCYVDTSIAHSKARVKAAEARGAAADARGAVADARGAAADTRSAKAEDVSKCSLGLVELAKDPKKQALGIKLLAGRPLEAYGPCKLFAELTGS